MYFDPSGRFSIEPSLTCVAKDAGTSCLAERHRRREEKQRQHTSVGMGHDPITTHALWRGLHSFASSRLTSCPESIYVRFTACDHILGRQTACALRSWYPPFEKREGWGSHSLRSRTNR